MLIFMSANDMESKLLMLAQFSEDVADMAAVGLLLNVLIKVSAANRLVRQGWVMTPERRLSQVGWKASRDCWNGKHWPWKWQRGSTPLDASSHTPPETKNHMLQSLSFRIFWNSQQTARSSSSVVH